LRQEGGHAWTICPRYRPRHDRDVAAESGLERPQRYRVGHVPRHGAVTPSQRVVAPALMAALLALLTITCSRTPESPALTEVTRQRSGDLEVAVLAPTDALKQTRNYCTLEFRTGADHHLVDVGTVTVQTTMTMDGEPMGGAT